MPARSNAEWKKWGEVDPLFGVASWHDRGVEEENPWSDEEFYAMGQSDWADLLVQWQSFGLKPGVCLEIGAGAGRLTRAMAAFFDHVHGIDVAPGMLKRAETALSGLPVTMHLSDGLTIPLSDHAVDAVISTHVFQHLDQMADAHANWREMARVLKPGGTFLVHLPVHMWPAGFEAVQGAYNARRRVGDARARMRRRRMEQGKAAPIMRGQSYSWGELEPFLLDLGFVDLELRFFRMTVNGGQHAIVMGRLPQ